MGYNPICKNHQMRILSIVLLLGIYSCTLPGQEHGKIIKSIFDEALTDHSAYHHLEYLCKNTKGRIPGSPAAAVIVRSATQALDDFPHTGVTRYAENIKKIPAVAVSTLDAEMLSKWMKTDPAVKIRLISISLNYPDTWSYNVIGELAVRRRA